MRRLENVVLDKDGPLAVFVLLLVLAGLDDLVLLKRLSSFGA